MKMRTAILMLLLTAPALADDEEYYLGPDSVRQEGVPQGTVTKDVWHSKVFPETVRDYWVYVPKQYDGNKPACVMVFQDGIVYVSETGDFRVPVVFDNLIHKREMPVTIGIFINPGHNAEPLPQKPFAGSNRSFEYNTLDDQYARFLLEEILPEVGKRYKLTEDPDCRAICGISSGGICAFTVAWQRPDTFRKVLSHVGSFTNIRGGHVYPALIRSTPNKPIRVFLQDGDKDLDNVWGNWWLANLQMEAAFKFKQYDYKFVGGTGGHSGKHGGAILPDSLRWLWRGPESTSSVNCPGFPIMTASVFERVENLLNQHGIAFQVLQHEPVYTSEEAASVRGTPLASGAKALVCKGGDHFVMFVVPADRRLDSHAVRRAKGWRKLRFATREEVLKLTGLAPGSIPPFGSLFDLPTLCDERLADNDVINFNAGDHSVSVSMRYADYVLAERPELGKFAE